MDDEEINGWNAQTLSRLVGIPPSTISSWIVGGLVTPEQHGRGRRGHLIGLMGLFEIQTILELKEAGFSMQSIRAAVKNLQNLSGKYRPLTELSLVFAGNDLVWRRNDELEGAPVSLLRKPGQRLMVLPVGEKHNMILHQLDDSTKNKQQIQFSETHLSTDRTLVNISI